MNLWSLLINWGTQFLIPADWIIDITFARSYVWFLNFYVWFLNFLSNEIFLNFFSRPNVLPKLCKLTLNCPKSVKNKPIRSILTCPNLFKLLSILKCSKSAKWPIWKSNSSLGEARNIEFGEQVSLIQRVPLGTLPQEVVIITLE